MATRAEKVQAVLAEWLQTETAWDEPHRETVTQQLKAAAIEYRKKEKVWRFSFATNLIGLSALKGPCHIPSRGAL